MKDVDANVIHNIAGMILKTLEDGCQPGIDDPAKMAALSVAKAVYRAKVDREAALTGMQLMINKLGK